MRHPKSLSVSYKLLIINSSILSQQKSDEVGKNCRTEYCLWAVRLLLKTVGFQPTFSRHGSGRASSVLLIWLNENGRCEEAGSCALFWDKKSSKWRECAMENFDFWYEKMGVK